MRKYYSNNYRASREVYIIFFIELSYEMANNSNPLQVTLGKNIRE